MNTQELRDFYQLNFENRLFNYGDNTLRNSKFPCTRYDALTVFLYTWDDADEIDKVMVPILQDVLNGITEENYSDAHNVFVEIYPDRTYFNCDKEQDNFDMPTQDYHDVLILWRDFLRESPLHGYKNSHAIS